MFLKALTIQGFKTFAQRTHFAFGPGITAIVGPNGSGKSNFADAIRWVLGEQSPRTLRSRRTEDVLFAGGAGRPPAGMAEVILSFDNSGHWLDAPFEEVTIARRAYRSGENEYYLNRDRTRLRDVADILGQASLGSAGFAIVGQGTVDAALSLRPEDRRGLIEQAASISHLYARLDDARQRLTLANQNLSRVSDLISEISPRLKVLERQARQAKEREAWQAEFMRGLIRWYAHLWSGPHFRQRQAELQKQTLRDELERLAERLRSSASERDAIRSSRANLDRAVASARETLNARRLAMKAIEQADAFDLTRRHDLCGQRDEFAGLLEQRRRDLDVERASLAKQASLQAMLRDELTIAEKELASLDEQAADWHSRRRAIEQSVREAQSRESRAETRRASALARQRATHDRLSQLQRASADHRKRAAELEAELADRQLRLEACRCACDDAKTAAERSRALRRLTMERHDAAQNETHRLATELAEIDRDLHGLRARLDALQHVESTGSAYFAGVRTVLQAANGHGTVHLNGIVGVVARLLVVAADKELAIETALGGHLQDIVVDRWADAEAAIAHLKKSGAGRATFLPLDTLRPSRRSMAPTGPGLLGVASSLIDVDPRYRIVSEYLLGQTLVVEDLGVARRVIRECAPVWQIVTLEGEITRPSGVVTGGAPGQTHGTLARQREIRQRRAAIDARESERNGKVRAHAEARQEFDRLVAELSDLTHDARDGEERVRQTVAVLAEQQRETDRALHALLLRREEIQRSNEQCDAAENAFHETERDVAEAERVLTEAASSFAAAQDTRAQFDGEVGATMASLTKKRSERDTLSERRRAVDVALAQAQARLGHLESQVADHVARLDRLAATLRELDQSDMQRAEERARAVLEITAAREEMESIERRFQETLARERECDTEHRQLQALQRDQLERLRETERSADIAAAEIDGLRQQVLLEIGPLDDAARSRDELRAETPDGTSLSSAIEPLGDPERVRLRLESLRHRLRGVAVNPEVITEFEEARERLGFLTEQSLDLQRTIATLQEAIDETRSTMKTRFDETFESVAASFSRRFVELFGGGSARLIVEGDDENSGIDVVAQPPGKRAETLSMLSGGERALTAAALLFALIEVSPPPFCVLDEVDAAMDESNVGRFCQALQTLSPRTQFIVITHNRRTMEQASAIYGLAVENLCESRVLSLRLPTP